MKKVNQKGFTAIEIILVIVTVGAIGVAGYFAYQNSQKVKTPILTPTPSISAKPNASASPSTAPTSYILNIKELGVSITLPQSLDGAVYTIGENYIYQNKQNYSFASFSTTAITAADVNCSSNGSAPPLGHISKVTGNYPANADVTNSAGVLVKQFSGYYISYSAPQAMCSSSQGSAAEIKATAARKEFSAALPSISAN